MKTAILIFTLIGLTSCLTKEKQERDAAIDFFMSQPRDPEIIGRWEHSMEEMKIQHIYQIDGVRISWNTNVNQESAKKYFYTKNDTLYVLTPAIMWKTQNSVHKYKYHIEKDNLTLSLYSEGKISDFPSNYKRVK